MTSTAANCITTSAVTNSAVVTPPPVPTQLDVETASLSSACTCLLGGSPPSAAAATATVTVYNSPPPPCVAVNLRIEGSESTIFENTIFTSPANVSTPSGGIHLCNGRNDGANSQPGGTPTTALQNAAQLDGFTFDGTFDPEFDDFFITSIGGSTETATQFWGILVDYQFTPDGGCQFEVTTGQDVLWAFDAFNKVHFLKLVAPTTASVGVPFTVTVTDGSSGVPVSGATVGGVTTNQAGVATVTINTPGVTVLKAESADSIRSNGVDVTAS